MNNKLMKGTPKFTLARVLNPNESRQNTGTIIQKASTVEAIRRTSQSKAIAEKMVCLLPVDVLLVHDATASISPVMEEMVKSMEQFFREISKAVPMARFGLIGYRHGCEYEDAIVSVPFRNDGNADFKRNLGNIPNIATRWWEAPVCKAMASASLMNWNAKYRIMVLIGDAKAHARCKYPIKEYAGILANKHRVSSYIIWWKTEFAESDDEIWFQSLAKELQGRYFSHDDISAAELAGLILGIILKETDQIKSYISQIKKNSSNSLLTTRVERLLTT